MGRTWCVLGVPSSAGAHTPGLEKGPAALREAGLVDLLRRAGCDVRDAGDVEGFRWQPDPGRPHAQNAPVVARVASDVAAAVSEITTQSRTPLVVGGDCTATVGVVAGSARAGMLPGLLYVDGGPDLYTPETRAVGNLDAMGLAHMLALPGSVPELSTIGPAVPLLRPEQVVTYGDALSDDDHERRLLADLHIARIPAVDVHGNTRGAADRARARIEAVAPAFVLHVDVDVLAFIDAPLADVPDSGGEPIGLTLDELVTSLATFVASPRLGALVLTEVNPDHVPDAAALRSFVERLTATLAPS